MKMKPLALALAIAFTANSLAARAEDYGQPANKGEKASTETSGDAKTTEMSPIRVRRAKISGYVVKEAATATKTDTPLMETPVNVQVVPEQILKEQQATTLDQALTNVSGVVSNSWSYGEESITMRGFQTSTVFVDGFRIVEYGGFGLRNLSNAQSIEVMKGPAAILYGAIEPGGIVNIVTRQSQSSAYYSLQQSAGSWNHYITDFDATGAINDSGSLLYRLDANYDTTDSWRQGDRNQKTFIAPSLKWIVSPQTQVSFKIENTHNPYTNDNAQVLPYFNGQFVPISKSRNLLYPYPMAVTTDRTDIRLGWSHEFNDDWSIRHQVIENYVKGSGNTGNITGFAYAGNVLQATQSPYSFPKTSDDTVASSLDLTGHFDTAVLRHTLLLGADYYRVNNQGSILLATGFATTTVNVFNPGPVTPVTMDPNASLGYGSIATSKGAYLQDQIKLPKRIDITVGLRYQQVSNSSWSSSGTSLGGNNTQIAGKPMSDHAVTPRLGLLWKAEPWLSVYGHYAGGFATNTGTDWLGQPLKSSDAKEKEIGVKSEVLGGKLNASLAYFDLTKTNVPTCDTNPQHNPAGCQAQGAPQTTIGEIRSEGVELDVKGEVRPNWNLIVTYAYTDARVSKSADTPGSSSTFLVGNRMASTPHNMGSLWSTYDFKQGDWAGWTIGGGVTARGSSVDATNRISTAGYALVNAMASYHTTWGKSKVTAQLNVKNLLDKEYINIANWASGSAGNLVNVLYSEPRSAMASLKLEY
ncbi:MAG: TonB-dependent siderophore receptor [Burkholderiales bacterium]|nr:TonB-dependent siderophore receptor [Burkholderiales bacterium]